MKRIVILGGGPAGSSAALAALRRGALPTIVERSRFPRHKVCGEFLSPEMEPALEKLGLLDEFRAVGPARVRRMVLQLGSRRVASRLPEPAFGLSRWALDELLYRSAIARGAEPSQTTPGPVTITATGRTASAVRGRRLFGFKAHFTGPVDDAVELFFFGRCYVGLNCVENNVTNVCGIAPEDVLRASSFDIDGLLDASPSLRERIVPLQRSMEWLHVGPLVFGNRLRSRQGTDYAAGDALSFVDPFTGTGLTAAVLTGGLAGQFAAESLSREDYLAECRRVLSRPFLISSALRLLAGSRFAPDLASCIPANWLFRLTRPRLA